MPIIDIHEHIVLPGRFVNPQIGEPYMTPDPGVNC